MKTFSYQWHQWRNRHKPATKPAQIPSQRAAALPHGGQGSGIDLSTFIASKHLNKEEVAAWIEQDSAFFYRAPPGYSSPVRNYLMTIFYALEKTYPEQRAFIQQLKHACHNHKLTGRRRQDYINAITRKLTALPDLSHFSQQQQTIYSALVKDINHISTHVKDFDDLQLL